MGLGCLPERPALARPTAYRPAYHRPGPLGTLSAYVCLCGHWVRAHPASSAAINCDFQHSIRAQFLLRLLHPHLLPRAWWRSKIPLALVGRRWLRLCRREWVMILHLGRSLLPMERPSLSSGSKIRREAADIHRAVESRRMEKNYNFRHSTAARVLPE